MTLTYQSSDGSYLPTGATVSDAGVNFSIFSRHATGAELLLYEAAGSPEPFQIISLNPKTNRSFFFWHVFVEALPLGTHYTWRMFGPGDTASTGRRFNAKKELIDPWAKAVTDVFWNRHRASDPDDESRSSYRAVVAKSDYFWANERACKRGLEGAVIYELHVGGFTRHPSAGVGHPGTFAGLIDKVPYLQELGITHVELLPVMAFDEQCVPDIVMAKGLKNYWGYNTHSFFSPHPGYCINPELGSNAHEFKDLVKALHDAGIGVILDVVFNHTAEGGYDGPTINFKGFINEIFYHLDPHNRNYYRDYTGCGNTVNCNHPLVTQFIVHCLEYWVEEMHVDGFRFDLASVFTRGEDGTPLANPPLPWRIEFSHALNEVPMIAEAWDASGLYDVGSFPGLRWAEWNGRYRDVIRRFVRGDPGLIGQAASCIAGSSDLYADEGRLPLHSINFISCHDGFTLHDLVSYNGKHNEANGEDNRDGCDNNLSWNCGAEGETDNEEVLTLRRRQAKNLMSILLLSQGVPMLLSGDEVLHTQRGNNNAYCQDNELSWFDWSLVEKNRDMLRFVRELIALRRRHPNLNRREFLSGEQVGGRGLPDITWHGYRLDEPLWFDFSAQYLAYTLAGQAEDEEDLYVILNMSERTVEALLPEIPGRLWHLALDTSRTEPDDIMPRNRQKAHENSSYRISGRTVAVFEARG
ncbi:MAG: glycogen debranching protein GlgX [Methylobacter sp.]|uniref:glycogen debranching protein GlgX n=1 Tax=Methylobacter sp. TaxID=2051955 RepID=UPI002731B77E|nr:glycogen debranching protein GlgX [Methylobacter sp.]MDP1663514.1 glycogen debranching protein GlgX [Methylobacter sp.]